MKRLRRLDRLLLLTLVPLLAISVALWSQSLVHPTALWFAWVSSPETPDDYPLIMGFPGWGMGGADNPGLQVGDRLVSIDARDLRGTSRLEVYRLMGLLVSPDLRSIAAGRPVCIADVG